MPNQTQREAALRSWWEQYRQALRMGGSNRVETFVRTHTPAPGTHGRRSRLFGELDRQVSDGPIESYSTTVLSDKFCLCDSCLELPDDGLIERVEQLASWRSGGICSTGFTEHRVKSSILDEQYTIVVPPETAFGIYVDETLVGVFPCMAAGVNCGPEAYLDGLAAGQLTEIVG